MSLIDAMQRKLVVEPIIVPFNRSLKNLSEYEEIRDAVAELEETKRDPKLLEKLKFNLSEMDKIIESGATSEATTMDKLEAWKNLHFDVMFHGDEWKGTPLYNTYEQEFENLEGMVVVWWNNGCCVLFRLGCVCIVRA